jgi:integrase
MTSGNATPARRVRVDRNLFKRRAADGKDRFELGYRDSTGRQRFQTLPPGITLTQARAERDALIGARGKGERIVPSPRLTFGQPADRWLAEQVSELRPATRAIYRNAIVNHLAPRWGKRRLDSVDPADAARLVRELRAQGLAERSIGGITQTASRVFAFARRHCGWLGQNPIPLLDRSERPRATSGKRRIFTEAELTATLAAALPPFRELFATAAVTGARLSELLGLTWADVNLADPSEASIRIERQVDRQGLRQPLKTDESRRDVELPRALASMLLELNLRSLHSRDDSFAFSTRSGRPLGQRNVTRELRRAMRAASDEHGRPAFPPLHERDEQGRLKPVPRGSVPSFHGYRHAAVSWALAQGESIEELGWQLGHRNSAVTRTVYAQEVKSAERTARRRARMEAQYGGLLPGSGLEAADRSSGRQIAAEIGANVHSLRPTAADGSSR